MIGRGSIPPGEGSLPPDPGKELMELLVKELIRRLKEAGPAMVASEMEVVRKLLQDNAVTLAHIRRGDYGEFAKSVAEDFPFDEHDRPSPK